MNAFRFLILCCALVLCTAFVAGPGQASAIGNILYVDADATGANNGTSWEDAFTDLQDALNAILPGDEIWVAEGTYKPSVEVGGTGPRYATFQMKNGVAIYGGFDPTVGDDTWEERDWEFNDTVLSGDIGLEGNDLDNCFHVFYHPGDMGGLGPSATLDGFTITKGNAQGSGDHILGGGMYNRGASPMVTNCIFSENVAHFHGGGMYNIASSPTINDSAPTITNCVFANNSATSDGGGMENYYGSPTITDCTFYGNSAKNGGGMYNIASSPVISDCVFANNSAGMYGGGMENQLSDSVITDCLFSGNTAIEWGGGIFDVAGDTAVTYPRSMYQS